MHPVQAEKATGLLVSPNWSLPSKKLLLDATHLRSCPSACIRHGISTSFIGSPPLPCCLKFVAPGSMLQRWRNALATSSSGDCRFSADILRMPLEVLDCASVRCHWRHSSPKTRPSETCGVDHCEVDPLRRFRQRTEETTCSQGVSEGKDRPSKYDTLRGAVIRMLMAITDWLQHARCLNEEEAIEYLRAKGAPASRGHRFVEWGPSIAFQERRVLGATGRCLTSGAAVQCSYRRRTDAVR